MYEFVQTATGWVLCWGGEALYHEAQRPLVRPAPEEAPMDAGREPVQTLSA